MWIHVPSTSLASVPAQPDSTSESGWPYEDLERSATLNARLMHAESWQRECETRSWTRLLSGLTSRPSTAALGVESFIASQQAILASHSPSSDRRPGQMTQGTSGPTSPSSSTTSDQESSSSKTSPTISTSDSEMSETSYAAWVIELQQDCLLRQKLARRTRERGSSHWGTPRAGPSSCPAAYRAGKFRLEDVISAWMQRAAKKPELERHFRRVVDTTKSGLKSSGTRHVLNPDFWTWLMNWPQGWSLPTRPTSKQGFDSWETASSRLVRRTLSAYSANKSAYEAETGVIQW